VLRRDVQRAVGCARWMQAWSPDVVWSVGLAEPALLALVASHLLGVPHILQLDAGAERGDYAALLPLLLDQAHAVLVPSARAAAELVARCGQAVRRKLAVVGPADAGAAATAVRAALAIRP
jgi:predicted nucleic acid-binding protein